MQGYKYYMETVRGKKVWIKAYKNIGSTEISTNDITVMIELNIIDKQYKVTYCNKRNGTKDNFIELSKDQEKEFIKQALLYAKDKGYMDKIINRCRSKY